MTVAGQQAAEAWKDRDFARTWAANDNQAELLDMPRRIGAALVAGDRPGTALVLDVASGPGAFLEVFLEEFPAARGVWSDASEAMLEQARERLARFGDRVGFVLADMTDLSGLPGGIDVICTSRASHHLNRDALLGFYRDAAAHLSPGGWLVNLDHIGPEEAWNTRLRAVKKRFTPPRTRTGEERPHHHDNYPLCSTQDHLDGYVGAGLGDVDIPWRAFHTVLFAGRKAGR